MKKNGFVSTALIYTFFIIFLILMVFLINSYTSVRFFSEQLKEEIKIEPKIADINVYIYVDKDNDPSTPDELVKELPGFDYSFDADNSYCTKEGSSISFGVLNESTGEEGLIISTPERDTCFAYFKKLEADVIVRMFTKENEDASEVEVKTMPNANYTMNHWECTNGATLSISGSGTNRKFAFNSTKPTECKVTFIRG